MLLQCRVAWEIWTMALSDIGIHLNRNSTVFDLFSYIISTGAGDHKSILPMMLSWRIWKMRNKLVYENKREHIIQVIHAAIRDATTWTEINTHIEETNQVTFMPQTLSINDVLPYEAEFYYIVDASWKSPFEMIGIGWSLYSKEDTLKLQGSSAMEATDTPLVAEAVAMREAVCQLHRLSYKNVTLLGDCQKLIRQLDAVAGDLHKKEEKITEAVSIIHDIKAIATIDCFSFRYVPRNLVHVVDTMAKKARMNHQNYVISWLPY